MAAERLGEEEIASRVDGSGWRREGGEIIRDVTLEDFGAAIALVDRIAEVAEAANHHPDILVHGYRNVRLSLTNHAAGGLTEVDFDVAERFERLVVEAEGDAGGG